MLKKLVFSALILSVFLAFSCAGKKDNAAVSAEQLYAENGRPVSVRELLPEDFSVYLKFPTVIHANSESTAYAAINDVVRTISVKVGNTVRQNDVVLSFSQDNQPLRQAALAYENAQSTYNRTNMLLGDGYISRQDFDRIKMQYEIAGAGLKAASDTVYVKAPIAGTITQINVRPTENVRPGMPLFTVSSQSGFEARFYVGAGEIEKIQIGARAFINDPKDNLEGRITQVSLIMDSQKQSFPVTAFFTAENRQLFSGMGADIAVETYRNTKAIVLSRKELVSSGSGYAAYVAKGDAARLVSVGLGQERGLSCEIVNGLYEGDIIVSEGVHLINEESRLNIVPAILASVR